MKKLILLAALSAIMFSAQAKEVLAPKPTNEQLLKKPEPMFKLDHTAFTVIDQAIEKLKATELIIFRDKETGKEIILLR